MSLYASLLGSSWDRLAPELRMLHGQLPRVLEGRLVASGRGGIAGAWVRRLAGMPAAGEHAGRLTVEARNGKEIWDRTFGGWRWRSVQWREGECLVEQFGRWQFRFRLQVDEGQLRFVHDSVHLRFAGFSLPLPGLLAPTAAGRERAVEGELDVHVEVRAPGGWKVLTYGGRLQKVEP